MQINTDEIIGIRARSLVVLENGETQHIQKLHSGNFRGKVLSLVDGKVKACSVAGAQRWARSGHEVFVNVVCPSTPLSNTGGFRGAYLAPDQRVFTQYGPVAASALRVGYHKIITATSTANPDQLSVIMGSLLGDGGFYEQFGSKTARQRSTTCGFWFSQSSPREAYATWKFDVLRLLSSGFNLGITPATDKHGETWRYALHFTPYFNYLRHRFPRRSRKEHGNRRLLITDEIFDLLGPLGLAVWFMDDGSSSSKSHAMLTASKLDPCEIEVCERRFRQFLGQPVPYRSSAKGFYFSAAAFNSLRDVIGPYIHPAVAYKIHGAGQYPYPADPVPGPLFEEEIIDVRTADLPGKYGENTRFSLIVPEAGNFLTLTGFVGCSI